MGAWEGTLRIIRTYITYQNESKKGRLKIETFSQHDNTLTYRILFAAVSEAACERDRAPPPPPRAWTRGDPRVGRAPPSGGEARGKTCLAGAGEDRRGQIAAPARASSLEERDERRERRLREGRRAGGIELARSPERPLPSEEEKGRPKAGGEKWRERDSAAVGIAFKEGKGQTSPWLRTEVFRVSLLRRPDLSEAFPYLLVHACATAMARFVLPSTRYCLTLLLVNWHLHIPGAHPVAIVAPCNILSNCIFRGCSRSVQIDLSDFQAPIQCRLTQCHHNIQRAAYCASLSC